ncbi:DoxX family protein [Variovorax sp. W6]|uniref:DoxX family protein n=1 Tax=Variovorax sp. W6 TaxID=3093895 RepID=UPI003D8083F5
MKASIAPPSATIAWLNRGALLARWIFVLVFAMALLFKLKDIRATSGFIGSAGFPAPMLLAWLAVGFETALVLCLASGRYFQWASLAAGTYVVFLAFAFHGPSKWSANQMDFGSFIDHFTFLAGLLYAAAFGPGTGARSPVDAVNSGKDGIPESGGRV